MGEGDREAVEGAVPENSRKPKEPPQSLRASSPKRGAASFKPPLTRRPAGVVSAQLSGVSRQGAEIPLGLSRSDGQRGDPLNLIRIMPAKGWEPGMSPFFSRRRRSEPF